MTDPTEAGAEDPRLSADSRALREAVYTHASMNHDGLALVASALNELAGAVRLHSNEVRLLGGDVSKALVRSALAAALAPLKPKAPARAKNPERWSFGARVAAAVAGIEEGLEWSDSKQEEHEGRKEVANQTTGAASGAPSQESPDDPF